MQRVGGAALLKTFPSPSPVLAQGEDGVAISVAEADALLSPALGSTSLPARSLLVDRWAAGAQGGNGTQIGVVQVGGRGMVYTNMVERRDGVGAAAV